MPSETTNTLPEKLSLVMDVRDAQLLAAAIALALATGITADKLNKLPDGRAQITLSREGTQTFVASMGLMVAATDAKLTAAFTGPDDVGAQGLKSSTTRLAEIGKAITDWGIEHTSQTMENE